MFCSCMDHRNDEDHLKPKFWRPLVVKQIYQLVSNSNRLLAFVNLFQLNWMIKVSLSDNNMQWFNRCCRIEVIAESWEHEVLGQIKNSDSFTSNSFENQGWAFEYIHIIILIILHTLYFRITQSLYLPESMRRSASFPFMKYMFAWNEK